MRGGTSLTVETKTANEKADMSLGVTKDKELQVLSYGDNPLIITFDKSETKTIAVLLAHLIL